MLLVNSPLSLFPSTAGFKTFMLAYLFIKNHNSQTENCYIFPEPVGGFSGIFPLITKSALQYCDRVRFPNAMTMIFLF